MDAAEYDLIATQLGAPPEEALYELACARWDLRRQPGRVYGTDPYEFAARVMTAARALPVRPPLPEVRFERHAWQPGGIRSAYWPAGPADEFMEWFEQATQKAAGRS